MGKGGKKPEKIKWADHIQEPDVAYTAADKIEISSIEEQEESNYRYWASLSPEDRLSLHYRMIKLLYNKELKETRPYHEQPIIFD